MDRLYLRAYFTSAQLADVKVGQEVTVVADYGNDKQHEYSGRITWIASESEFTPKTIQTRDTQLGLCGEDRRRERWLVEDRLVRRSATFEIKNIPKNRYRWLYRMP